MLEKCVISSFCLSHLTVCARVNSGPISQHNKMADNETIKYKINGKAVSKEEYNELESKLIDIEFYQCKMKVDGGVSTETAKHKDNGKQFYIVRTIKNQDRTYNIEQDKD
jgi:hypothetical protein